MQIELLTSELLTHTLEEEIAYLYRQLNAENKQRPMKEVLESTNNVLAVIGQIDGKTVGIALLSTYKVISGYRGLVEDVVVDSVHRGKGIGRKLMQRLLDEAKLRGLDEILLFTGHHRTPAIGLYTSLGFEARKSGIYNLRLVN